MGTQRLLRMITVRRWEGDSIGRVTQRVKAQGLEISRVDDGRSCR